MLSLDSWLFKDSFFKQTMVELSITSILPPIIVVVLAVKTKNIIFSLFAGVASCLAILAVIAPSGMLKGSNPLDMTMYGLRLMSDTLGTTENLLLIIFLAVIGGIIGILTASGCANAFSNAAACRINSKRRAEGMTFAMGCIIFIDDYFNAITVGNMMVAITDRYKISRARLAYLIDSTSAPVTVLMPVSSWVATIISMMTPALVSNGFEMRGMSAFLIATSYNLYAWLTLVMVAVVIIFNINIGDMRRYERDLEKNGTDESIFIDVNESAIDDIGEGRRGTTADMLAVLLFLIIGTILMMLYTGGIRDGSHSIARAFMDCDPNISLATSSVLALILCFVLFVIPGKLQLSKFGDAFVHGVKSMVMSIVILILSWTFSALLGSTGLRTGEFLALIFNRVLPGWMLPVLVFIIAALISFSTGASWGAMAITIPTSVAICASLDPAYIGMVLGAALAGSVFGDHCSPLADTTVMSSSGAGCKHLVHVATQLPYAIIVAAVSVLGYIVAGLTHRGWIAHVLGVVSVIGFGLVYNRIGKNPQSDTVEIGENHV